MGYCNAMRKAKKTTRANNLLNVTFHPAQSVYIFKMIKYFFTFCLIVAASAPLAPPAAQSQSNSLVADNIMQYSVLPGWRMANGNHMAALHIQLKPGWKTYWRAPGDGGIPPQFYWGGSENIAAVKFHWPRPTVDYTGGMRTIVYENQVIIPMEFSPHVKSDALILKARADLGICKEICMPVSLKFSANLPANATKPDPKIKAALKKRPTPAAKFGVKSVSCLVEPISDGLRLTATIKMPSTGKSETVAVEIADQNIWVAEPGATRIGNVLTAVTDLVGPSNAPFMLDRSTIRFTVIGPKNVVDIQGCTGQ